MIPDNDNSLNFLVSLLYAQAFQALYYSADQIHHGALPCHVHFVLDEFAAMPLPGFTRELVTMRSRNISASTIIQNMAQIKELYKGSVSAQTGERLLIPINMRDGSLLCTGKGNKDWNFSAPHGAGRLMSRSAAKESFTVSEFRKQMEGIYTTSVGQSTLDECPMAYKDMSDIVGNIGPTATVDTVNRPIYNFKAGEGD